MESDNQKVLLEEIREIKRRINDIDLDLEGDRERLQDFVIRLENVESEVKATRQAVNKSSETIKNKVADVSEPIVGAAMDLTNEIKEATKKGRPLIIRKKNFWQKLFKK